MGNIAVWKMSDYCISEWEQVYSSSLPHERIIKTGFLSSSKVVRLNPDKNESVYYAEKFHFDPQVRFRAVFRKDLF